MLNVFKFHNDPASIHSFEQSIQDNPSLLTEIDIPNSPVILKVIFDLLNHYKDDMYHTIDSVLHKKFYREPVFQRIMVLCSHGEYKKNPTLLKILFNGARSLDSELAVGDIETLVSKNAHIHNNKLIPGYVAYLQSGDSALLVNSLLALFDTGEINVYLLIGMIDAISKDPNIYNKIFKKLPSDYEIRYELQKPHAWSSHGNVTTLVTGLWNMNPIVKIYHKLPEKLQKLVRAKFMELIAGVDSKLSQEITNYKITNLRCNDGGDLKRLNDIVGNDVWPQTRAALSNIYHNLNSPEATKNINKLTGNEQKEALSNHTDSIKNIIGCMSAFR